MPVIELESYEHYAQIYSSLVQDQLLVLDFTASWCGPCRKIAPVLEELSNKYAQAVFVKADVERIEKLAQQFKVAAMPTFAMVRNDQVVAHFSGANPQLLEDHIVRALGEGNSQ